MDHGSIGILPFDLMNTIFLQTSIQAAASIYLSCKYWRDKYKHIVNHDIIFLQIETRYIEDVSRRSYTIKKGCVSYFNGVNYYKTSVAIDRGFFSSVQDLVNFLRELKEIMTAPEKGVERSSVRQLILRTTSSNGASQYFGYNSYGSYPLGMQILSQTASSRLYYLMCNIYYIGRDIPPISDVIEDENEELKQIEINVKYRKTPKKQEEYDCNVIVRANGEGNFEIRLPPRYISIRTLPKVYEEILDIVKYNRHKTDISTTIEKDRHSLIESFELILKENNELYYIQEYKFKNEEGTTRVENNGYKTNAIKKVLKILERVIQYKSMELNPFWKENIPLPPVTSYTYTLARIQHYSIHMYGFPIISHIVGVDLRHCQFASSLEHKKVDVSVYDFAEPIPIEEIISLLLFVQKNMEYCPLEYSQAYKKNELQVNQTHATNRRMEHFRVNKLALNAIYALVMKYYVKK